MKKIFSLAEFFAVFALICMLFTFSASAEEINGWFEDDKGTYYYREGKAETGLTKIGEYTYYFNDEGIMQTGWVQFSEGKRRFHLENGSMLRGRKKVEDKIYYFGNDGLMKKGWIKAFGKNTTVKKKARQSPDGRK